MNDTRRRIDLVSRMPACSINFREAAHSCMVISCLKDKTDGRIL